MLGVTGQPHRLARSVEPNQGLSEIETRNCNVMPVTPLALDGQQPLQQMNECRETPAAGCAKKGNMCEGQIPIQTFAALSNGPIGVLEGFHILSRAD